MKRPREIPEFKSMDEEKKFWEIHDSADYSETFYQDYFIAASRNHAF